MGSLPQRWLASLLLILLAGFGQSGAAAQGAPVELEGRTYLPLTLVAARMGMDAYWLKGFQTYRLRSRWSNIDFPRSGYTARINGVQVHLGFPTRLHDGVLHLSEHDFQHVVQAILTPQVFDQPLEVQRIVIDPGHGGKDPGAVIQQPALQEKDLALETSLYLAERLREHGFEVILVRDRDVFIALQERARVANRGRGDLFVSVHFNAAANRAASGIEVFSLAPVGQPSSGRTEVTAADRRVHPGNALDARNTLAAYHLQRSLLAATGAVDRGAKRARFAVLRPLETPGVLVELGFMTHAPTAAKLQDSAHLRALADALADGIVAYRDQLARFVD